MLKKIVMLLHSLDLVHLCLASDKRNNGRQCRPRSDAAERGV